MTGSDAFTPTRRTLIGAALLGAAGSGLRPATAQTLAAIYAPPKPGDTNKITLRFASHYVGVHPMGPGCASAMGNAALTDAVTNKTKTRR